MFSFANSNGAEPSSPLVQGADGFFYGTTEGGGTNGNGTVFGMTTNGLVISLYSFQSTNGLQPLAGLVQGRRWLFLRHGQSYGGAGFQRLLRQWRWRCFPPRSSPRNDAPAIVAQPASQIAPVGGAPLFSVNARGAAPLSYSWQRNGIPLAGATQSGYTANDVQLTDSGDQFTLRDQ